MHLRSLIPSWKMQICYLSWGHFILFLCQSRGSWQTRRDPFPVLVFFHGYLHPDSFLPTCFFTATEKVLIVFAPISTLHFLLNYFADFTFQVCWHFCYKHGPYRFQNAQENITSFINTIFFLFLYVCSFSYVACTLWHVSIVV